jgi:hypothetical protein
MAPNEPTQRWEYHIEIIKPPNFADLQEGLNYLGLEGWELIGMTSTIKTMVNMTGNDLVLTFKRPLPQGMKVGKPTPPVFEKYAHIKAGMFRAPE